MEQRWQRNDIGALKKLDRLYIIYRRDETREKKRRKQNKKKHEENYIYVLVDGSVQRIFVSKRKCECHERGSECAHYSFHHPLPDAPFNTLDLRYQAQRISKKICRRVERSQIWLKNVNEIRLINYDPSLPRDLFPSRRRREADRSTAKVLTVQCAGKSMKFPRTTTMYIIHKRLRCLSLCTPNEQILRAACAQLIVTRHTERYL